MKKKAKTKPAVVSKISKPGKMPRIEIKEASDFKSVYASGVNDNVHLRLLILFARRNGTGSYYRKSQFKKDRT